MYHIYNEKYEDEKDALNEKDKKKKKKIDYTELRLADGYLYESEENKQAHKKPDKKKPAKKTEISDVKKFSDLINKEETGINRELFKRFFNFQRPSTMLKAVYNTDNKEKNRSLINVINRVDSVI